MIFDRKICLPLLFVLLCINSAVSKSDEISIFPENPTSYDSIIATISGCRDFANTGLKHIETEIEGNNILINADLPSLFLPGHSCFEENVKVHGLPRLPTYNENIGSAQLPGDYTIKFVVTDSKNSNNDQSGEINFTVTQAMEAYDYTIAPYPSIPISSERFYLRIAGTQCTPNVTTNGVFIDDINLTVNISLNVDSATNTPCQDTQSLLLPITYLTPRVLSDNSVCHSRYQISIFDEDINTTTTLFEEQNMIGSFSLPVGSCQLNEFSHEVPAAGSIQSGIGIIRGWACHAKTIEVELDDGELIPVAYGTSREDTRSICGDANNGYGMVVAWGILGEGLHRMKTFIDGVEVSDVEFEVSGLGEEFIKDLSGTFQLQGFPTPEESVTVEWNEANQNFIVIDHTGETP